MRRQAVRSPSQPRLARRYRRSDEVDRSGPCQARSLWQTVRGGTTDRGGRLRQATPPPPTHSASCSQIAAPYSSSPLQPPHPPLPPSPAPPHSLPSPPILRTHSP